MVEVLCCTNMVHKFVIHNSLSALSSIYVDDMDKYVDLSFSDNMQRSIALPATCSASVPANLASVEVDSHRTGFARQAGMPTEDCFIRPAANPSLLEGEGDGGRARERASEAQGRTSYDLSAARTRFPPSMCLHRQKGSQDALAGSKNVSLRLQPPTQCHCFLTGSPLTWAVPQFNV